MITLTISEETPEAFVKALSRFFSLNSAESDVNETTATVKETKPPKPPKPAKDTPTPPITTPVVDDGLGDDDLKTYTQEDIKKIGREHASRVGADKVREFIKTLGAESLTLLTADKYPAFVDGVAKLKP